MILIAGDSFSDTQYALGDSTPNECSWTWWLNAPCTHRAVQGSANFDILHQTKGWRGSAIVNLSAFRRLPLYMKTRGITLNWERCAILNRASAERIIKALPDAYIWSPFPEYEHWPEVHYVPIEWGNALYDESLPDVGNHLTRSAHVWLAQHMREVINTRWGEMSEQ